MGIYYVRTRINIYLNTGEAEAYAIEVIAKAEAEEKMAKQADAWKDYGKAAMVAMMLKTIPQVLGEITRPLSWGQLSKITMISDDKGDVGASKLTDEVIKIMKQMPNLVKSLTGVDMSETMITVNT